MIKSNSITAILSSVTTLFFLIYISPNFMQRITINYGDSISNDPFRTTNVAAYRSDDKEPYLYLKNNIQKGDIWISLMSFDYFSFPQVPDYLVNQNLRWNTSSYINDENEFFNPQYGSVLVNTAEEIKKIIAQNPDKRIWLLVNGSSINIELAVHARSDFLSLVQDSSNNIVFKSKDGYSEVLLFNGQVN